MREYDKAPMADTSEMAPTCIKSLQLKFPGLELNAIINSVRIAGPDKNSIYRFIAEHHPYECDLPTVPRSANPLTEMDV